MTWSEEFGLFVNGTLGGLRKGGVWEPVYTQLVRV